MTEPKRTGGLDRFLSHPWFYLIFTLIAIRANDLKKAEKALCSLTGLSGAFPALRVLLWALCAAVLGMYIYRWCAGQIRRRQPLLWCFLGMHGMLILMTIIYRGASGYWLHWTAGLCLMLALDMGLQRERQSLLNGISLAFLLWVACNIPVRLLWPAGLNAAEAVLPEWYLEIVENAAELFAPEWLIGNRVFYYRIALPALMLEMVRAQACDGKYGPRTALAFLLVAVTVVLQRGGTAMLGFALLLCMILFFNRRALPRWATPAAMLGFSAALFIGIYYFHVQELFAVLIERGLGKDTDLTARVYIWEKAMDIVGRYPLTGVGLLPVEYTRHLFGGSAEQPFNHTHNQLLEILMHGGVLALLPYLGMAYLSSREVLRHRRSAAVKNAALLLMVFLFMGTVDNFHNEPIFYPLFMLCFRAGDLAEGGKKLPRISAVERIKRDIRKR